MIVNLDSSRNSDQSDDLMGDFSSVSQVEVGSAVNSTPGSNNFGRDLSNTTNLSRRTAKRNILSSRFDIIHKYS